MHQNPAFRTTEEAENRAFADARSFGAFSVNGGAGPLVSHAPFLLEGDGVEAHLVRSNPIARLLAKGDLPCVIAVTGPDGYVSPDWYGAPEQVPTWNYVAVHLRGVLRLAPAESLRDHLDRLSAHLEARLAPKPPWLTTKTSPDVMAKLMRMIVPVAMTVETVEGTWKLNQNKTAEQRAGAADHMATSSFGQETAALAEFMRDA